MLVYAKDKQHFLQDCEREGAGIGDLIHASYQKVTGRRVAEREIRSWRESLKCVADLIRDGEIPESMGFAVEMHLPNSQKRIDVCLSGYNELNQKCAILIELKQWESAEKTDMDAIVITRLGGGLQQTSHPSYQAWSYATLLEGFNESVYEGGIQIHPCAFLHNYRRDGVIDDQHYSGYIDKAPLFLMGGTELNAFRAFIKNHIVRGDQGQVIRELDASRIRPSKALADAMRKLMKGNREFVLIDEQKEVFEFSIAAARKSTLGKPRVIIIEGGPGTGKSVLAINLLVQLTSEGLTGKYVSKNAAPRRVYESKLSGSMTRANFAGMFSGSGSFIETAQGTFDFLVVDEAHRLNEKGGLYGNQGDNQVKELIEASNCTIFFLDEDQRVTLSDIGSREVIEGFANQRGASIERYELASQFRCGGSDGYLAWLDQVLDIRETANHELPSLEYDFRVFDDPEVLHQAIIEKNSDNRSRVVAGYCWPWLSKKNPAAFDIVIGDYSRQWNLGEDGSLWIIAEKSVEQVGCIHTCQGLEVDYIGVIIGDDLIVRDGRVITNPASRDRHDRAIRGYKSLMKKDPLSTRELTDLIIKNTYRTLMTRGMKGCYIYCTDTETSDYFRKQLQR